MDKFFGTLQGIFESLYDFIAEMVSGILVLYDTITATVPFVYDFSKYLPSIIGTCVIMVVSTAVIKFICGR